MRKLQRSPRGWQRARREKSARPGEFNVRLDHAVDHGDLVDAQHTLKAPSKKRPVRCHLCPSRFAYPWTRDEHLRKRHAAELPGPQPTKASGPVKCRWCPNGYQSQAEATLHEQAFHARNLALDIGGYSTAGA